MTPRTEIITQTMQTVYDCIVKAVERGYYESFRIVSNGLTSDQKHFYNPGDITISRLYKCQTHSTPAGTSVLYLIKTNDGRKGTLLQTHTATSDSGLANFIQKFYEHREATLVKRKEWFRSFFSFK